MVRRSVLCWLALCACGEPASAPAPEAAPEPVVPPASPVPSPDELRRVPQPPPNREVALPTVVPSLPTVEAKVQHPLAANAALTKARGVLEEAVRGHGRDPENPWAVGHAMLALGPEVELTNGVAGVDHLFAEYAEWVDVADTPGVAFPRRRGPVRIEPHSDLLLKAITEGGVAPAYGVTVQGKPSTVLPLYRHSLHRTWIEGDRTGFDSMNDTPWALQALSSWAPPDLAWTAIESHEMTLDGMTTRLLELLEKETAYLSRAKAAGAMPQKDGKGILSYTCGGQHLVQGVAHAVARGFGPDDAKERMCAQRDLLLWRIDHELGTIDPILAERGSDRALAIVLLDQRLKFVGHALETTSKIDAYGMCPWDADDDAARDRLGAELVRTVTALDGLGVFAGLGAVRTDKTLDPYRPNSGGAEQVYLDLVGDAAHAVRGIDLALGTGVIRY